MTVAVVRDRPVIEPRSLIPESLTITWRNLVHIKRQPEMLLDVTIQPIMFVLLFAFVFGGSITVPGVSYREFLVPGIMAQTIVFSSFVVAIGLTNDLAKGIVDRFRSLPISGSAVLVGRSISSLIHSMIGVAVMGLTGLAIGWSINNGVVNAVFGFFLLLLFGFSMIWLGIWVGSMLRTIEAVQGLMFTIMFPLTFVANTFAPTAAMPPWLRFVAEWNPVSALTASLRLLWGNDGDLAYVSGTSWALQHPELMTIIWSAVFTVVFAPLAVRAYRRRARD